MWVTNRVEDGEDFTTIVENPSLGVSLQKSSDDQELNESEEAGVRGDGKASRVFLKNGRLHNEPTRPGQAVANQKDTTKGPVFSLRISQ